MTTTRGSVAVAQETATPSSAAAYTFSSLERCTLSTKELANLGPDDTLEPCIVHEVLPYQWAQSNDPSLTYSVIPIVQVTPSNCHNHRDGAVTGVEIDQQRQRFTSAVEKQPAKDLQAIVLSQVGPPAFYTDRNPYVFGIHINSDLYPLPNVQVLDFLAQDNSKIPNGPSSISVKVIYRTKSEFFYSTCRSAIDKLTEAGFTDITEILYDHAADHDNDGDTNQFDVDFLEWIADQACPSTTVTDATAATTADEVFGDGGQSVKLGDDGENSAYSSQIHPAIYMCTLTEQTTIPQRLVDNGCRRISTWVTAATWGWANENQDVVPYFQGGGQFEYVVLLHFLLHLHDATGDILVVAFVPPFHVVPTILILLVANAKVVISVHLLDTDVVLAFAAAANTTAATIVFAHEFSTLVFQLLATSFRSPSWTFSLSDL